MTEPALACPAARTLRRLRAVAPREAEQAAQALEVLLAPLRRSSWPELVERFSSLTNTGYPVEFAWSSRDALVRYASEVAAPELPDDQRLAAAVAALRTLGAPELERALRVEPLQSGLVLRFGAWIGARHAADHDAYKLYAELPALDTGALLGGCGLSATRFPLRLLQRVSALEWRMAGFAGEHGVELYARAQGLALVELERLGEAVAGRGKDFAHQVSELCRGTTLPRPSGLSIAFDADAEPMALTWLTFAKSLYSSDAAVRAALLAVCPAGERSAELYAALTAGEPDGRWQHAMLGAVVERSGRLSLQAGVRPA